MRTRIFAIAILAAIGSLLIGANDASAWGRHGVSTGCYGVSTGCYGVSTGCYGVSTGCYGVSTGCYGSVAVSDQGCYGRHHFGFAQRRAARMHARYAARGCNSGCVGSWRGGCYSSCYSGCYVAPSCCGSTVSYDSAPVANGIQAAPAASPAPAAPPEPAVSPEPEAPAAVEGAQLSRGTALLAVEVPAGTKIYVNGIKTKAEGSQRKYMSSGLIPGRSYQYLVQAVLERGGKQRAITKRVTLTAGSEAKIQFVFTDAVQPDALLTFYVPDEASVN